MVRSGNQPGCKTLHLQFVLPVRCAEVMTAQSLGKWSTNNGCKLKMTPRERAHAPHCLYAQEPEAG